MKCLNRNRKLVALAAAAVGISALPMAALAGGGQPPNDLCFDPIEVVCGTNVGSNQGATGGGRLSCPLGGAVNSNSDVWFEFTAPATGTYTIDTLGSGVTDTVLGVFTGCEGEELVCDDDGAGGLKSSVDVLISSGQRVLILVAAFGSFPGTGDQGSININIACPTVDGECCDPWDNGRYDGLNAQTSQVGFGEDWRLVGRVAADDFWLCESNIYKINTVRGTLLTDSVVPKATVLVFEDCDGRPGALRAYASSIPVDPSELPLGLECLIGDVEIIETGTAGPDGTRLIDVRASWDRFWLRGGAYWVSIFGFSGTADPDEQFFWGTSRGGVIQGRPAHFLEANDISELEWNPLDECCIGCTDLNFCVEGETCKILLDNGGPAVASSTFPGSPSLQNGTRTADKSRSADQFVVPPCVDRTLCYVEAWVWTNCDRVSLDLYASDCHCPAESDPIATYQADCVFETGIDGVSYGGVNDLRLVKAIFHNGFALSRAATLEAGRNYWLSAYGQGDNRQNARAYFAWNSYCDRTCWINFDPGCTKGPPYGVQPWRSTSLTQAADFAFLVAVEPVVEAIQPPDGSGVPTCQADVNGDRTLSVQDLFDFLSAYFAGCP